MFYGNKRINKSFIVATILLVAFFIGAVGFNCVYAQESKSSGVAESGFIDLG